MPRKRKEKKAEFRKEVRDVSLGELYKGIAVPRKEFVSGETKLVKKKEEPFVRFCKWVYKAMPSLGKGGKFSEKHAEAIAFLGWDLNPEEFSAASKFVMLLSVALGMAVVMFVFLSGLTEVITSFTMVPALTYLYVFFPIILLVFFATKYVQDFPLNAAKVEQTRALTYVPEIIGYMIMSMKLVPNLEKAVEFSAEHGRGKIADDFKKVIWDVQLGVFNTLSEALDDLAYRWGKFSEEFKQALMMIRASVLEGSEAKRYAILDKTMTDILESIRGKMEQFARELSQPTIMLFYLGVLLPLVLIIILPVGSAFTGAPMAKPEILFVVYNVVIPLVTVLFVRKILIKRPPTYEPPQIPDSSPLLPPKNKIKLGERLVDVRAVVVLVLVIGGIGSFFLHQYGIVFGSGADPTTRVVIVPPDKTLQGVLRERALPKTYYDVKGVEGATADGQLVDELIASRNMTLEEARQRVLMEKQTFLMRPENDVTPYNLLFGLLVTGAIAVFVFLYFTNIYKRKVQLEVMQMESEFKDSLYVLASRMGENKPVEEALQHTKDFLPTYKVSKELLGKTVDNINLLGMPLEVAVFDPVYGSMRFNPSSVIRSSMRLLVDSVQLGVNVAARTLISLSLQLSNSEKVTKLLSTLVADITTMMRSMSTFIAPMVLGITTSLQKVVMITLSGIVSSGALTGLSELELSLSEYGLGGTFSFGSEVFLKVEAFAQMVNPAQFIAIVSLYVIELVVILMYFTTKISEDNDVLARINIAKTLPIAVIVFVVSVLVSNSLIGGFR
jgi:hypothetical protein